MYSFLKFDLDIGKLGLISNKQFGYIQSVPIYTLLTCLCMVTCLDRADAQVDSQHSCGFDSMTMADIQNGSERKKEYDQLNKSILEYSNSNASERVAAAGNVLPVVVHLISPQGTDIGVGNNLTDEQVRDGLELLNQSFRNEGPFFNEDGVNTEIQFCLASRTPDGQPSSGITRTESNLVAGDFCSIGESTNAADGVMIKGLINWPCNEYINIWLVTNLYNDGLGCSLAGFATLPNNNCGPTDGVMQESRYWTTVGGTGVTAHELGHFLGLLHTFNGGCANDDCTTDGDLVCDTPPDDTQGGSCTSNSCNTDIPDLIDDSNNYMDYTSCTPLRFSEGQKSRMLGVLATARLSLCESIACSPVLDYDLGTSLLNSTIVQCDPVVCPGLVIRNLGLETVTSFEITFDITGFTDQLFTWSGSLAPNEKLEITLPCNDISATAYDIEGTVSLINGTLDENVDNSTFTAGGAIYEQPQLSLDNLIPTGCISDGVAVLSVSGGEPPYGFTLDDFDSFQAIGNFGLLPVGTYQCIVEDANGCRDELDFDIVSECIFTGPDEFIINGDAFSTGNQCFTLTRELFSQAGSIWYESKIDLNEDFQVAFTINLGDRDNGADGVAFLLQPLSTTVGDVGGGIGYLGATPSFACEFDTYQNFEYNDPAYDHLAIQVNGQPTHGSPSNLFGPTPILDFFGFPFNAEDGDFHEVAFDWDASTQTFIVNVDCRRKVELNVDLINDVFNGDPEVFFGFTSATGGSTNVHQVCFEHVSFLDSLPQLAICSGDSIGISLNPIFETYEWTPLDHIVDATTSNPTFSPEVSTWYKVKMDDGCGYIVEDSLFIAVLDFDLTVSVEFGDVCDPAAANEIRIDVSPLTEGVAYSLDGINYSDEPIFTNVSSGSYTIFVKGGSCLKFDNLTVDPIPALRDSLLFLRNPNCQNPLGLISVAGLGGTPPYSYTLDGGVSQPDGLFDGLTAGLHELVIIDQNNCQSILTYTLADQIYDFDLEIIDSDLSLTCIDTVAYVSVNQDAGVGQILYYLDKTKLAVDGVFQNLSAGPHTIWSIDENGCNSDTLSFIVQIDTMPRITLLTNEICAGDNVIFGGDTFDESGTYIDSLTAANGCDSIVILDLLVFDIITENLVEIICEGDAFMVGASIYDQPGEYVDTLSAVNGCDSIITLDLSFVLPATSTGTYSVCDGDSVRVGESTYTVAGMYIDTLQSMITGCDSIISTELIVFSASANTQGIAICSGDSYILGDNEYTASGIYIDTLINSLGCDSIVTTDLEIIPLNTVSEVYSICLGDSLLIRDSYYSAFGNFQVVIEDAINCDTILDIEIVEEEPNLCDNKFCASYVPNVFSPNNDSTNDQFSVYADAVDFDELYIYDRWGSLIFHKIQAQPQWDGTFKGKLALEGVYVYLFSGTCVTGERITRQGNLTLIR